MARPFLSKTRLISAWQCPKKAHLEKHHKELGVITTQMQSAFAGGHQVGAIAQQLYGTPGAKEVEFNFRTMVADTRRLLEQNEAVFEGSFRYENVLIRADVMVPEGDGWHVLEVKASTSVKDYHVLDCAIQDWVLRHSDVNVLSISLAHINREFEYRGAGDYDGLLVQEDLTADVRGMEYEVLELVAKAREALSGPLPQVDVGAHCTKPYECQFMAHCWPTDTKYPVAGLGGSKARLGEWIKAGALDIRDVDAELLTTETAQRIQRVTTSGEAEILPGVVAVLNECAYPRFYLDFETIAPAIPFWADTRPYAVQPIQWSVHVEEADGEVRHEAFLDLSGEPPMRELAMRLIDCLGDTGTVFMYTAYEKTVINALADRFPDLAAPLKEICERLVDLKVIVKQHYYHPGMQGSWSIKAVTPCIAPLLDYKALEGIQEGSAAADGFVEAIDPNTTAARKAELETQLLRYCQLDTEAMLAIVRFLEQPSSRQDSE